VALDGAGRTGIEARLEKPYLALRLVATGLNALFQREEIYLTSGEICGMIGETNRSFYLVKWFGGSLCCGSGFSLCRI
jgi:hypothetical protein